MSLKLSITTAAGIAVPNAIHTVEAISLGAAAAMSFRLRSYASAEAAIAFDDAAYECPYDINGVNPFAQAYAYLKGLPEFAGAEDC